MASHSLPELFKRAATARPGAAVSDGRTTLSYKELDTVSDHLAVRLAAAGVGRGERVGLQVARTVEVAVAVLGILKAGAAYVPLDPAYPVDRLRLMVADADVRVLVGGVPDTDRYGIERLVPVRAAGDLRPVDASPLAQPTDPAYVIYTSGSTGTPKGCVITHANVLALLAAALPRFDLRATDRWALFHSISFDFSVWELWGALATGADVVLAPEPVTHDGEEFVDFLIRERITVLNQVPSVFRTLVLGHELAGRPALPLRYVVFGGESVDLDVVARWRRNLRHPPRMVNMYGITEITVHATIKELEAESDVASPIGVALPHLTIELRDDDGTPVPDGEPGEMWIAGASVAAGYLHRPQLTEQRFVTVDGRRYYRSGDLARRLPDGQLEYLGRVDQQIKLRGFRIELGEIEAVLRAHAGVRQAAVAAVTTAGGATLLVACVCPTGGRLPTDLRQHAARSLPSHMLPQRYVRVEQLPRTPSGKLDRAALPVLAAHTPER